MKRHVGLIVISGWLGLGIWGIGFGQVIEDTNHTRAPADSGAVVTSQGETNAENTNQEQGSYTDPNEPASILPVGANGEEQADSALQPIQDYWRPRYHPQVSRYTFEVLAYPYFYAGKSYAYQDISELIPKGQKEGGFVKTSAVRKKVGANQTDPKTPDTQTSEPKEAAEEQDTEATSKTQTKIEPAKIEEQLNALRYGLERCCHLIHQWRSINEAPGTALEITRTIELSRTNTNIFRYQPQLAVQVKRIIGQIHQINRHFDLTSRLALNELLSGHVDKVLISRMEKQITDLQTMLGELADYNDQIGIVLGIGPFDRSMPVEKPLQYANLQLPPGTLPQEESKSQRTFQLSSSEASIRK